MSWATGHDPRRGAPGAHRTRRLVVAVAVSLVSAVGLAAADSAIKAHYDAAPVDGVAAAAYSTHRSASPSTATRLRAQGAGAFSSPVTVAPVTTAPPTTSAPPTTTPPTTASAPTSTVPRPAPTTVPAPVKQAVATALQTRSTTPAAPALSSADSCSAAISYLSAHSAPGFRFECPGYALGHQAMTCINVAGVCPGAKLIVISVVCPASYMNEAHNSWVLSGLATGSIDPYGYCH